MQTVLHGREVPRAIFERYWVEYGNAQSTSVGKSGDIWLSEEWSFLSGKYAGCAAVYRTHEDGAHRGYQFELATGHNRIDLENHIRRRYFKARVFVITSKNRGPTWYQFEYNGNMSGILLDEHLPLIMEIMLHAHDLLKQLGCTLKHEYTAAA